MSRTNGRKEWNTDRHASAVIGISEDDRDFVFSACIRVIRVIRGLVNFGSGRRPGWVLFMAESCLPPSTASGKSPDSNAGLLKTRSRIRSRSQASSLDFD
jgi:hypothetical protein